MTIQEAIKSGKPFKRSGHNSIDWKSVGRSGLICYDRERDAPQQIPVFSIDDILATDWEVKP